MNKKWTSRCPHILAKYDTLLRVHKECFSLLFSGIKYHFMAQYWNVQLDLQAIMTGCNETTLKMCGTTHNLTLAQIVRRFSFQNKWNVADWLLTMGLEQVRLPFRKILYYSLSVCHRTGCGEGIFEGHITWLTGCGLQDNMQWEYFWE